MPHKLIAFFALLTASVFLLSYLGHRYEKQSDYLLSCWWGLPIVVFGAPLGMIAGSAFLAGLVA